MPGPSQSRVRNVPILPENVHLMTSTIAAAMGKTSGTKRRRTPGELTARGDPKGGRLRHVDGPEACSQAQTAKQLMTVARGGDGKGVQRPEVELF